MKKIVVTGGSGGAGRYVIKDLLDHGYQVHNLDRVAPKESLCSFNQIDLTDYASVFTGMSGYEAVVHFGANPIPDFDFMAGADRFKNNTLSTYNIFNAAVALGMERVVWASSETVLGFPFEKVQPYYLPVDEKHRLQPQNSYALSKVVCEELAYQMNHLYGIPIIGLRLSNVLYTGTAHPANYEAIPSYWSDPMKRKFNLWGYIDARDSATSVRLSLEANITTSENFIVAAQDTIMNRPNRELIEAVFPEDVTLQEGLGEFDSLLSTKKANLMLGFTPQYSWRNVLDKTGS